MTTKSVINSLLILLFPSLLLAQYPTRSNIHIGLVYPLSTNGTHAADYTNLCSFHAIAGVSKSELSFCATGFASIVKDTANGFIGSGFANIIGKDVMGGAFAGFINYTGNNVYGFAGAGVINVASGVEGVALAGFANIIANDVNGLQGAGFINVAKKSNTQLAGFINVAGEVPVAQAAGFINVSKKAGAQVAGFANVAEEVSGAQIAGFINIAKKVKGAQIAGFINIADSSEYPIGLINIVKNGEQAIGVSVNETGTTIAAFRSGGRILYGIIGLGANPTYNSAYAMQAGLGAHLPLSRAFRINFEASTTWLYDFMGNSDLRSGIRAMPSIRFGAWELFAGPSFNFTTSKDIQGIGKTGYSVWSEKTRCRTHDLSLGIEAGIQLHLNTSKPVNSPKKNIANE